MFASCYGRRGGGQVAAAATPAVAADLEGLFPRRDEAQGVESQLLGRDICHDQVAVMYGIERPPKEADHPAQAPVESVGQTSRAPGALGWNRRM